MNDIVRSFLIDNKFDNDLYIIVSSSDIEKLYVTKFTITPVYKVKVLAFGSLERTCNLLPLENSYKDDEERYHTLNIGDLVIVRGDNLIKIPNEPMYLVASLISIKGYA